MREKRKENREQRYSKTRGFFCSLFSVHCSLPRERGFTLIEMIVAVALFAVVMLISVGALLALTGANRKAQGLQAVMNNLNITLDGMVRNIRMGTTYDGSADCSGGLSGKDCTGGTPTFSFTCNPLNCVSGTWTYKFICPTALVSGSCPAGGYIQRSKGGAAGFETITAPEVSITSATFYVVGTNNTVGNYVQPKVLLVIRGTAQTGTGKTQTTFHIEATAVQRELDLPKP